MTGSALVWMYCTRPKTAPTKQITMPRYISVDAADAAQAVEFNLGQIGNMNIRFARESGARRAKNGDEQQDSQPSIVFLHKLICKFTAQD